LAGRRQPAENEVMGTDELWNAQLATFGNFLRAQRRLANLSLREMSRRTKLSNAYLSQIERGLHTPSVRVLRLVAQALDISVETLLAQVGLWADDDRDHAGSATDPSGTEIVIRNDPRLTEAQKEALLSVYRSYIAANRPD
jgi:transcriptional regulator with XRE-family HTH domain